MFSPTPTVEWRRENGDPPPDGARIESSGLELVIYDVQYEDAGGYICEGSDNETRMRHTMELSVECMKQRPPFIKNCHLILRR